MNVVTRLSGGLGNQLFQYAAARRLALAHRRPLVLDLNWYHDTPAGSTPRRELLSKLRIVASFADSGGDPTTLAPPARGLWARLVGPVKVIRERTPFRHDPRLDAAPGSRSLYLDGYWQCFRYFEAARDALLDEIRPQRASDPRYDEVAAQIDASVSVMLHIRRGDYVHSGTAAPVHGALPLSYYERALALVRSRHAAPTVFVFSDDIAWAREHLRTGVATVFVDNAQREDAVIDELMLMCRCRHQIIANSSLSWWAAWLNRSADKMVTAPQRWLSTAPVELVDLIPPQWQVLPID